MPKPKSTDPEQLDLIEVDGPEYKAVKKELTEYASLLEENREQASANRSAEPAPQPRTR